MTSVCQADAEVLISTTYEVIGEPFVFGYVQLMITPPVAGSIEVKGGAGVLGADAATIGTSGLENSPIPQTLTAATLKL